MFLLQVFKSDGVLGVSLTLYGQTLNIVLALDLDLIRSLPKAGDCHLDFQTVVVFFVERFVDVISCTGTGITHPSRTVQYSLAIYCCSLLKWEDEL